MFSTSQPISASALVIGALAIALPFQQQGSVLGAEAEAVAPTRVTGDIIYAPRPCTGPDSEQDGAVRRDRNLVCYPMRWAASDPRFSGTIASVVNEDVYRIDDEVVTVSVFTEFLSNAEGGWTCTDTGALSVGDGDAATFVAKPTSTCVGQGGYEGLSAILVFDDVDLEFEGLIFPGDVPPVAEPPTLD